MKRPSTSIVLAALALSASPLCAQENPPPRPPESRPAEPARRPDGNRQQSRPGIFGLLDANRDGSLDPDELSKAGEALRRLDRNQDNKITPDEMQSSGDGQRPQRETARSGGGPRPDANRDRQPQGDRPRDHRPDAQQGHQARGHEGSRGPQQAQRSPQSGDLRRDQGRQEGPRIAPRMEGAQRPPMSGPPSSPRHGSDFSHGQPRHDVKPGQDRMMQRPQGSPAPGGPPPMMRQHQGPRPPQDRNFQPPRGPDHQAPGAI